VTAPAGWTPPPDIPPRRLLLTLGGAGAVAGALIVTAFRATAPAIEAYRARVLQEAVREVLHEPARYDTLYLVDRALTPELPQGRSPAGIEQVYAGFNADSSFAGIAIAAAQPGFQDVIRLIFGYDPQNGDVIGMKVLEMKETPGLGDKIEKDSAFVSEFRGAQAPLVGVKARSGTGDPREVDMITGATISSRAVIKAINNALDRLGPALQRYVEELER
jgi:electron transport complex protein RnfG